MHYYDDCGYYFPGPLPVDPTPLPFPFNEDQINAVIDILVNGRLCGTITITPGLMLVGAIGLMKQGVRRRRRRSSGVRGAGAVQIDQAVRPSRARLFHAAESFSARDFA